MSQDLYRDITDLAHDAPGWLQLVAELWTEAGLLLFGVLFLAGWWRARPAESRAMALAVLAPLGTAFGYVVSELLKSVVDEERPCRAVAGAAASIVQCPAYGDWSFPSNHSAIAGAAAVALALAWRGIVWLTVPMALLMAFSRVFVGVHYPHDVAAGLVLGALMAVLFVKLLTGPVRALADTMRMSRSALATWLAGPGPAVPVGGAVAGAGRAVNRRRREAMHRRS
ncbi:phosphatase PAP2 family protein [Streptomyces lavendofoliae]|uniref:phosphatase PAP2 family protein n=1 Tax=Streptomyces lavendofoliae TaxID=67314 RepID=UPI00300EB5A7